MPKISKDDLKQGMEITKEIAVKENKHLAKLRKKEQAIKDREESIAESKIKNEVDDLLDNETVLLEGELSNASRVIYTDDHKLIKITNREKGGKTYTTRRIVYQGLFRPVQRLNIDGNRYYEIELNDRIIGNIRDILNFMRINGGVISNNDVADCLNAIISNADLYVKNGHSTYGVYNDNNKLSFCFDPYCVSEEQKRISFQVQNAIKEEMTKESIQGYIDALSYWNPYEIAIAQAYGIMAPFAYVLKEKNVLFPYVFHTSPESCLGKSLVAKIFSQSLYGIISESMASVYSDFRISDALDSICGPKCIDEAQKYNWHGPLGEKIKQSAENPIGDKRGSSDRTTQIYLDRLVPIFTGNGFPISGKADLVRFFRVEYDMSKKEERSKREKSKTLIKKVRLLHAIGFRLVEHELKDINYSLNELIRRIDEYGDQIVNEYGDFTDARRPTAWGIVYEGLKAWERVCKEYKVDWSAPSIKEFVNSVVKEIETVTFESKEIPVEDFLDWFVSYREGRDGANLCGKTWETHTLNANGGDYEGVVVTSPVLKSYNKETKYSEIKNMGDLARGLTSICELSKNDIHTTFRFLTAGTKKGVFIYNKVFSPQTDGNMVTKGTSTGGKKCYHRSKPKKTNGNTILQEKKESCYHVTTGNDRDKNYVQDIEKIMSTKPRREWPINDICFNLGKSSLPARKEICEFLERITSDPKNPTRIRRADENGLFWRLAEENK